MVFGRLCAAAGVSLVTFVVAAAQTPQRGATTEPPAAEDPVRTLVAHLDLEKYKATIKGLTRFGDRRQGTDRNRAAIDWIEAQLKSYGCTNTERLKYEYHPAPAAEGAQGRGGAGRGRGGRGGAPTKGFRARTGVNNDPARQP